MNVLRKLLILISVGLNLTVLLYCLEHIDAGDYLAYKNLYELYQISDVNEFFLIDSADYIGSRDWLPNILFYISSKVINFSSFNIIIGIIYFILIIRLFCEKKLYEFLIFLPFTFYTIGIQFSALRLEIAIIIFLGFYLYSIKYLGVFSILAHSQVAPIFTILLTKKNYLTTFLNLSLIFALLVYFNPYIIEKFIVYYNSNFNLNNKSIIWDYGFLIYSVIIVSISYSKIYYKYIFQIAIFFPLIYMIGPARLNILIFIMMLISLNHEKPRKLLVIVLIGIFMIYDLYKGINFIYGISIGNSGFDSIPNIIGRPF